MAKMVSNQARNYAQFSGRPDEFKRKKNQFDLSHDVKTTFSMGQLIPFLTLETLPGDYFEIDFEVMCRFAPLFLPIMHRCDMTIHYFYVPNRIIWPEPSGWSSYITQKEDLLAPYFDLPVDPISAAPGKRYSIPDYMGFPTDNIGGGGSSILNVSISMLPIAAYWAIFNEYYRNPQIQPEINLSINPGFNDITSWDLYLNENPIFVAFKMWNRDYFTSSLPTPQVGAEVLVPMFNPDFAAFDDASYSPDGPFRWRKVSDDTPVATGDLTATAAVPPTGKTLANLAEAYLDTQETAATMRQFRLAARMLEFLERLMRTGQRYRDFLKGHFGVDPDPGTIDLPIFIGGSKGRIIISEVMATAETTNETPEVVTPLGAYAGQALAMESGRSQVKYFCKEHGFVLGIINIQPRSSYMQGLSKMWTRGVGEPIQDPGSVYDYAWEQFAGIGDQEIKFKELRYDYNNVAANINHNEETFAYIPRYSEYRWNNDIISGQMRTIWQSFHLGRIFTNDAILALTEPVLNAEFISNIPRVDDIFQIGAAQDHEIYCHIFNTVNVWRALPKFGVPSL